MAILSLVEAVGAYFAANGVRATAVYGERARARQGNERAAEGERGGRVAFAVTGGAYEGPKFLGPRVGDPQDGQQTKTRAICQLVADVDAEIWAFLGSAEDDRDDAKLLDWWLLLHEHTVNAIRRYAQGVWVPTRLTASASPAEVRRGVAFVMTFTLPIPILQQPHVVPVAGTYAVTSKFELPKGQDADGEPLPTTTIPTWSGSVEPQ